MSYVGNMDSDGMKRGSAMNLHLTMHVSVRPYAAMYVISAT